MPEIAGVVPGACRQRTPMATLRLDQSRALMRPRAWNIPASPEAGAPASRAKAKRQEQEGEKRHRSQPWLAAPRGGHRGAWLEPNPPRRLRKCRRPGHVGVSVRDGHAGISRALAGGMHARISRPEEIPGAPDRAIARAGPGHRAAILELQKRSEERHDALDDCQDEAEIDGETKRPEQRRDRHDHAVALDQGKTGQADGDAQRDLPNERGGADEA